MNYRSISRHRIEAFSIQTEVNVKVKLLRWRGYSSADGHAVTLIPLFGKVIETQTNDFLFTLGD